MERGEAIGRVVAILVLIVASAVLGVAVLIYGWGLHPASWGWIIGGVVFQLAFYAAVTAMGRSR